MKFSCPKCHNNIDVSPDWYGRTVACPHAICGKTIIVPIPTDPGFEGHTPPQSTPIQSNNWQRNPHAHTYTRPSPNLKTESKTGWGKVSLYMILPLGILGLVSLIFFLSKPEKVRSSHPSELLSPAVSSQNDDTSPSGISEVTRERDETPSTPTKQSNSPKESARNKEPEFYAKGWIAKSRTAKVKSKEGKGNQTERRELRLMILAHIPEKNFMASEKEIAEFKAKMKEPEKLPERSRLRSFPIELFEVKLGNGVVLAADGIGGEGYLPEDAPVPTYIGTRTVSFWVDGGKQIGVLSVEGLEILAEDKQERKSRTVPLCFTLTPDQSIPPFQIRFDRGQWIEVPDERFDLPPIPMKEIKIPNITMPNINVPTFSAPKIPTFSGSRVSVPNSVPNTRGRTSRLSNPGMRTWTDSQGRKMTAKFVRSDGTIVVFQKSDGKQYSFEKSKLISADQALVERLRR